MENLVEKNIMIICKSKIKETIAKIICYVKKITIRTSNNKKYEPLYEVDLNEGEKLKLNIMLQIYAGRKLY